MKQIYIIIFLTLTLQTQLASSQALHWLSQPEVDIGSIANNGTSNVKISTNGRYITFISSATNLVENDTNGYPDVFIRDMQTGVTKLVSTTTASIQATDGTLRSISAPTPDGRYVAFVSNSSNFPGYTGLDYLYVKDMQTGALINHSDYNGGSYFNLWFSNSKIFLSDDGQFITFAANEQIDPLHTDNTDQVYRKNLSNDTFELLSISHDELATANEDVELIDVSSNGRYVLIVSDATNLTTDILNNAGKNIYLVDTLANSTILVNKTPSGASSTFDSADYLHSRSAVSDTGAVVFVSWQPDLVINDNNSVADVFYLNNGSISRINLTQSGQELTQTSIFHTEISADGSRILFTELYDDELFPNLSTSGEYVYDLYSYNTATATLSLVSQSINGGKANGASTYPRLADNGNRAVFLSSATDLNNQVSVSFYNNIFHYDFNTGLMLNESQPVFNPDTILSSVYYPGISSNQRYALYASATPNFIDGIFADNNDFNLFLLDRNTDTHSLIARNALASDMSASGNYIAFTSQFLQPNADIDLGADNAFLYDRLNDSYTLIAEVGIISSLGISVNDNGVVVFSSKNDIAANDSNGIKDIYAFNPMTQTVKLISEDLTGVAAGGEYPSIGGQGNNVWISFISESDNLINNDTNGLADTFFVKYPTGTIARASQTIAGIEANGYSFYNKISNDGSTIAFVATATNLTADDYTLADNYQVFTYNRLNQQITLASKNENDLPIVSSIKYFASISDTGRYVSYVYEDDGDGLDFSTDTDRREDVILFDTVTQVPKLISQHLDGTQSSDGVYYFKTQVVEDTSQSPARVGVIFAAYGGDLTGLPHHPGHQEVFLYQQGGPDINLTVNVQGPGTVLGGAGFTCTNSCQVSSPIGTNLTFTAVANTGIQFIGWQIDYGNCNDDSNPCELILDRDKNLTAIFLEPTEVIFANGFEQ